MDYSTEKRLLQTEDVIIHWLWDDQGRGKAALTGLKILRIPVLAVRGLFRNQALVRSAALAYAAILGFIPLLALLFAILQAMGLPRLLAESFLQHLAPGSRDFATQVFNYIENTKVTSLGVFGLVALLLDLVVVMTNVEKAFNKTWQVSRTRSWSRKVSDYLSIFLIFPIFMAVAVSVSTHVLAHPDLRHLFADYMPMFVFTATQWLTSLVILWLAFIFIYLVMPNARVKLWSAVIGGVMGGTVWQVAQLVFIWIQGASTYYNAIYGALYNLLFLFIWIFWCWLILLFGTEVAFAHQHLERLTQQMRRRGAPKESVDEYLALAGLVAISARFARQQPPLAREDLENLLAQGDELAPRLIQTLLDCRLIVELAPNRHPAGSHQYLPAVPLEQVTAAEVLQRLRQRRGAALSQTMPGDPGLLAVLTPLQEANSGANALTLHDLAEAYLKAQTPPAANSPAD